MNDSTELKILLFLAAFTMIFAFIGFDTQIVGEQLCVDGNHNINLEGIRCEKSESTWFGLNLFFSILSMIPFLLFFTWTINKN